MDYQRGHRPALFVLCPSGLGLFVQRQALEAGMNPGEVGNDGRADVVRLRAGDWDDARRLTLAEVVCADLGTLRLEGSLRATVAQVDNKALEAALADLRGRGVLTRERRVRLVVRLRTEQAYTRTALRDAVARQLRATVVRGHESAQELWLLQTASRQLRLGLRVRSLETPFVPRPAERPGSLPRSIAAAMVMLAGARPGRVLDPCCGTGTLLAAASRSGWLAIGGDLHESATAAATHNASTEVIRLDARRLPFRDNEFDVVLSNLPFGHQHEIQGSPVAWYRRTMSEAIRVAPRAVLLAPPTTPFRQALGRLRVSLTERHDIEVLGRQATIWVLSRTAPA